MHKIEAMRAQRQSTYRMLIIAALAIAAGRMAVVTRDGETAFLSANDRSRWCTVATLVERGTYVIDAQQAIVVMQDGKRRTPWQTIDKVRHTGDDGKRHFYSSKPPLLPTMVAALYAVVRPISGMTLTEQPMYMTRILLALVNLPLLALFYFATTDSIERICRGDWVRRLLAITVCFGTMLLPFAISLNNHLPAAAATAAAMWIYIFAAETLDDSFSDGRKGVSPWWWFAAGLAAAFAAANELPALSMLVLWGLLFFLLHRPSMLPFAAGVLVVAIGFFGTNWMAHGSLRPPYAHRGNGEVVAEWNSGDSPDELSSEIATTLSGLGLELQDIVASDEPQRWVVRSTDDRSWLALLKVSQLSAESSGPRWQLAHWDDWYEYDGSYWRPGNLRGVDRGEPSRWVYFVNMTVGHHGLFSLTPIWLLVPLGLIAGLGFGPPDFRRLVLATLLATSACIVFYVARPEIDRNYGGVSVCFRWLLWLAPLWLLVIAPAVDRLSRTQGYRITINALLAASVFSVSTALQSPWQQPWIYQFWVFLGWIDPS
jgi:hypothetical protein